MKKQIVSISPVQTGKVFAVLYFLLSLPFVAMMAMMFSFSHSPAPSMIMLIVFPFMYMIFGFIFTVIAAWVYNLVAGWVGGIEYTSATVEEL